MFNEFSNRISSNNFADYPEEVLLIALVRDFLRAQQGAFGSSVKPVKLTQGGNMVVWGQVADSPMGGVGFFLVVRDRVVYLLEDEHDEFFYPDGDDEEDSLFRAVLAHGLQIRTFSHLFQWLSGDPGAYGDPPL